MSDQEYIINECLTYISYYINNSTINNIFKLAVEFYEENEIIEAKKKLWEARPIQLSAYPERKKSENRSCAEAHLTDIVDALQKLDNEQNMPSFVAQNIERLPDRQPEELNLLRIINRLSNIEKNIKE